MHATDFARKPKAADGAALVVLHGSERHLKSASLAILCRQVLGTPPEESIGLARFAGKDADFKSVRDELLLVSMFSSRKLIVVEDADDFITEHRAQLEAYADKPSKKSLLVLDVKSWRKNTRLAKKVDADGLEVDCGELTGGPLYTWLGQEAKEQHGKQLSRDAAQLMVELAGTGLGLLSQELGKLAAYIGDRDKITPEDVQKLVGGWKAETTWHMIDAIRDGKPGVALNCLSKLLYSGEPGPKILGGINYVFKKFALAVERGRKGQPLKDALKDSGVFPRDIAAAETYLRRMKRKRAEQILEMLARADYGLKGGSKLPDHLLLEQLILWLSGATMDANVLAVDS